MSVAEALLPEFDREFATTRKFLAIVPDDKLTWKPHVKSMELGRLALHLSDTAVHALTILTSNVRTITAEDIAKSKDAWKSMNRAKILEHFDTKVKAAREALAKTPDSAWGETWKLVRNGSTEFETTRSVAFRMLALSHQIHHRAQLGVYYRLNDILVPATYGTSADDKGSKK